MHAAQRPFVSLVFATALLASASGSAAPVAAKRPAKAGAPAAVKTPAPTGAPTEDIALPPLDLPLPPAEPPAPVPPAPPASPVPPASPAPPAPPVPPASPAPSSLGLLLGVKVGGRIPLSPLGATGTGALEVGWTLPALEHRLVAVVEVAYAQPRAQGSTTNDPRVDGGTYAWSLLQRELTLSPGLLYRLPAVGPVTPFVGLQVRVHLLESVVQGSVGAQPISITTEKSTKVGVGLPLGAELPAGPGAVTGELLFEYGPLDHLATGPSTSTAGASVHVGYRVSL